MPQTPSSRELVNDALHGQLSRYLVARRNAGVTVRVIVEDLHKKTDVLVTERTVWRWIDELTEQEES